MLCLGWFNPWFKSYLCYWHIRGLWQSSNCWPVCNTGKTLALVVGLLYSNACKVLWTLSYINAKYCPCCYNISCSLLLQRGLGSNFSLARPGQGRWRLFLPNTCHHLCLLSSFTFELHISHTFFCLKHCALNFKAMISSIWLPEEAVLLTSACQSSHNQKLEHCKKTTTTHNWIKILANWIVASKLEWGGSPRGFFFPASPPL